MILLLLSGLCIQDLTWYEHYQEAERLYEEKKFSQAMDHLEKAVAVKPKAQADVFIRATNKIDYKPHFYRALCAYQLGELDRAMEYARLALSGEVVSRSPALQFELAPIFQAYSKKVGEYHSQIRAEQQWLERRKTIAEHLVAGRLEEARKALAEQPPEQSARFADLLTQLANMDALNQREDRTRKQALARVEVFLERGQGDLARAALQGIANLLSESQWAEWNQAISAVEAAAAKAGEENPQQASIRQQEIARGQNQIRELEEESRRLKESLANFMNENQSLQAELSQNQAQPGEPAFPPPSLTLTLRQVGWRHLSLDGHVFVPSGLVSHRWFLNEEPFVAAPELRKTGDLEYRIEGNSPLLPFGSHHLALEVEDRQGKVGRLEREFTLARPLFWKLHFWLSLVLASILAGGSMALLSFRRRERARLNFFNPYIAGSPIQNEKMFFGRKDLILRIQNLVAHNCLMIYGERRMGKTSLLYQLKNGLAQAQHPDYTFFPAFVDLQGILEEDLFHHIMGEMLAAYPAWAKLPLSFDEQAKDYRARAFSRDVKAIIQQLTQEETRQVIVVLLMDEVDVINEFSEKTNQKLRSIFMKDFASHLSCIMAGIHLKKEWESSGSPWYNFFEEIPMTQLEAESAEALIQEPLRGIFRIDGQAKSFILQSCGGHPYLIQKVMVSLTSRMIQQGKRRISRQDVEETLRQMSAEMDLIKGAKP
jgi:hypothetical protein